MQNGDAFKEQLLVNNAFHNPLSSQKPKSCSFWLTLEVFVVWRERGNPFFDHIPQQLDYNFEPSWIWFNLVISVVARTLEIRTDCRRFLSSPSFSSPYQAALLAHLFGVWFVMHHLSLPFILSTFYSLAFLSHMQRHRDTVASTGMDAGQKHGQDAKIFQIWVSLFCRRIRVCRVNVCTVGVAL